MTRKTHRLAGQGEGLRIGELARTTGISVRALHHYDELGLLSPSGRTATGHRRYDQSDIARLQQIRSLRQLGFSLSEIRDCLDDRRFSPRTVIALHRDRVREQTAALEILSARLDAIATRLASTETISVEELISTIEAITMTETKFTPEEMAEIQERGTALGPEHIRKVEAEWPALIALVQAEIDKGTAPSDPRVRALATRWSELVREFTGGNPSIEAKMRARGAEMQKNWADHGSPITPTMLQYIAKARQPAH